MVIGTAAERPAELTLSFGDRTPVDAGEAQLHQATGIGLPVLIAAGSESLTAVVVVLAGKADRDGVVGKRAKLPDCVSAQPIDPRSACKIDPT